MIRRLKISALILCLISPAVLAMGAHEDCKELIKSLPLQANDINHKVFGEDHTETIVLIHGLDSAWQTFKPIIEPLSENFRVIVYDQRGHGKTVDQGTDFSSKVMAEDLHVLLKHLRVHSAHVLGHSMGGRTAVQFAALHPEMVRSVIVEDMEMNKRSNRHVDWEEKKKFTEEALKLREKFSKTFRNRKALIKALKPHYGDEAESLSYRRAKENEDGSMTLFFRPHISYLYGSQGNAESLELELKNLKVPALFIGAGSGASVISKNSEKHLREMDGVEFRRIKGSGHNVHGTARDEYLKILSDFIYEQNVQGVSAMGTQSYREVEENKMLPKGSALITDSGALRKRGITAIIHAATGSMTREGELYDPTLDSIRKSVTNSIKLAERYGYKSLAIPMIGGKIFLRRMKRVKPQDLARAIVETAYNYGSGMQITFVAVVERDAQFFMAAKAKLAKPNFLGWISKHTEERLKKLQIVVGDLLNHEVHKSRVIVNAANMEVVFGGGLSGAIGAATEDAEAINEMAAQKRMAFYRINNGR